LLLFVEVFLEVLPDVFFLGVGDTFLYVYVLSVILTFLVGII
jgi:hypothetical protein